MVVKDDFSYRLFRNFLITSLGYLLVSLILGSQVGYAQGTATVLLIAFICTLIAPNSEEKDLTQDMEADKINENQPEGDRNASETSKPY